MGDAPIAIIGAGVGGLIAAIELGAAGRDVVVLEAAPHVGGKMRTQTVAGQAIDAGPTVFTLADVFDATLARAGMRLADELTLRPADVLARHVWTDGSSLDLFADSEQSAAAIGALAGERAAAGYRRFRTAARQAYRLLDEPFMRAGAPRMHKLLGANGPRGMLELARINPFASLWQALGRYFDDPRLRQLFARYATYTGSDPFQATASLMLIAHVEQRGVWQIEGGMAQLAECLARVAERVGVTIRCDTPVARIETGYSGVTALRLADDERLPVAGVICNADARALAEGRFGDDVTTAVDTRVAKGPALSGVTWAMLARPVGRTLSHHNVFFCADYAAEFRDIFTHGRLPSEPTVYICAQDRRPTSAPAIDGPERLLCLANAPPVGTRGEAPDQAALAAYETRVRRVLDHAGLALEPGAAPAVCTGPAEFAAAFPGSRGALYGQAAHGWRAPFQRPTAGTRIPGLFLAGGGVHPGAGLPMAALSGQHAATALLTERFR